MGASIPVADDVRGAGQARIVSDPPVSIVIPTRNGGSRLTTVIDAIRRQRFAAAPEIVVVDSGSTDGSQAMLSREADVFIEIEPRTFNHGTTRNLGVAHSRGPLLVTLVQDAVPQGDEWLATLLAPLEHDPSIAGAFARQVPCAGASPLARRQLAAWVAGQREARVMRIRSRADYDRWSPLERLHACAFDNVCAAFRRSVWMAHPFPEVPIAEDLAWGREVLLAGHGIAYAPDAAVEHSHDRSAWYELKRTWVLHQELHRLFGVRTIPSMRHLARAIASTALAHRRWLRDAEPNPDFRSHVRGQALAFAWPLGQYLGGMTAVSGRAHWRPAGV
jgi:glycosyltransferase involved in cell wall biosynthesis